MAAPRGTEEAWLICAKRRADANVRCGSLAYVTAILKHQCWRIFAFTSSSLRGADGKQRGVDMNVKDKKPVSENILKQAEMYEGWVESTSLQRKYFQKLLSAFPTSQELQLSHQEKEYE